MSVAASKFRRFATYTPRVPDNAPSLRSSPRIRVMVTRDEPVSDARSSCVSAKGPNPDAAKAYVKWLWVDQEDFQVDFSDAYGTHIPAKPALAPRATKLATGAGADAARFVTEFGHAPSLLWTSAIMQAYTGALTRVVTKGADPQKEIAAVAAKATAELQRVNG